MINSYVVKKEQCPSCAKQGKDSHKDNLAVYSDGRRFCFSCRYIDFPSKIILFRDKMQEDDNIDYKLPYLPIDCDTIYPERALEWVEQYELTREDLYRHNALWSETMQRLIFPMFADGQLLAWQGRSFFLDEESQKKYPKWFGKGNLKDTFNIINQNNRLVLTEDIISAIKVSKCGVGAMPLFGCQIGRERFKRLYSLIDRGSDVLIWLDPDKRKEALLEERMGLLSGLATRVIFSSKDPKEHSFGEIEEKLKNVL